MLCRLPLRADAAFATLRRRKESSMAIFQGVDASAYQGVIDWRRVKEFHIDFAILRATIGNGMGQSQTDRLFHQNICGAAEAGLFTGAYHSSLATNANEARREAECFLDAIRGYKLAYPVAIDIEDRALRHLPADTLDAVARAWCKVLRDAGYHPMIRAGLHTAANRLTPDTLREYELWLLRHGSFPDYDGNVGIWQYTVYGSVGGVRSKIGCDKAFRDYPAIIRERGLNGFTAPAETRKPVAPNDDSPGPSPPAFNASPLIQAVEILSGMIAALDVLRTLPEYDSPDDSGTPAAVAGLRPPLNEDLQENAGAPAPAEEAGEPDVKPRAAHGTDLDKVETGGSESGDDTAELDNTKTQDQPPVKTAETQKAQHPAEPDRESPASDSVFSEILDKIIEEG